MIKFSTWVNVPADRRVTLVLPPEVPIGPVEVQVAVEPPAPDSGPVDPKLAREMAAFQQMLPELLAAHRGRYVAVHDGQVVVSGPDRAAVWREAHQRFGQVPILVREVTETPRVVRIATPFRRPPAREG
jgi:hypothetical protein